MQDKYEEKRILIEEMGVALEERADLTPLAARIYAALILSCYEGLLFEEIIAITQASKSSVSNNLNILVQLHYVEYYTRPGDRKRHFRTTKYYVRNAMEQYEKLIERELDMVKKINAYNKEYNPQKFKNENSVGILFQEYLTEQREKIKTTIEGVKNFQKQS
ncbi:DNA-binding transcriptional regulator GbsR, MarR family [Arenibacter nanhaiticus]|uniref:DNA-binding transcriptional regulator GbsR, MarR family n=1 Tax=Arenibacter nanhaiticus TaxID=558155 RepID=A0A1M6ALX4_9FLAO|nr:hypothetical protein [Arenibacter nanhaiticus]SHI37490.1 DNA-binding transcriptional regulator GbsR, MarR family [Arenibacter nanhaiticus]